MADVTNGDVAFMEFATERGKEPPSHVHAGEDEMFFLLSGELTVTCGNASFDAGPGDFVFLPADVPHTYAVNTDGLVHLLVVTICRQQDGRHFGRDIEHTGEPVTREVVLDYMAELRKRAPQRPVGS
jgi:quercetin dioxygenase-like cupin family protein